MKTRPVYELQKRDESDQIVVVIFEFINWVYCIQFISYNNGSFFIIMGPFILMGHF